MKKDEVCKKIDYEWWHTPTKKVSPQSIMFERLGFEIRWEFKYRYTVGDKEFVDNIILANKKARRGEDDYERIYMLAFTDGSCEVKYRGNRESFKADNVRVMTCDRKALMIWLDDRLERKHICLDDYDGIVTNFAL